MAYYGLPPRQPHHPAGGVEGVVFGAGLVGALK